MKKQELPC